MSQSTVKRAGPDSTRAHYRGVSVALCHIVKEAEDKKVDSEDTLVKLCELLYQDRKFAVSTHPAELARVKPKVASLTNYLELKKLEPQVLSGSVKEAACLRKELKKVRSEESDFDVPLQNIEVLQSEVPAILDQVASLLSAVCSDTERSESICASFQQKKIDVKFVKERESSLKKRLNAVKVDLSSLLVGYASRHWACKELNLKVLKLGEDLGCALKAIWQKSVEGVVQVL